MLFLLQFFLLLHLVFGGSKCPPRADIYPCICINKSIGKNKFETTLVCHNLENDNSFSDLNAALVEMEVDRFLLYDSFWKMTPTKESRVPVNVLNGYRIKEVEIVDTTMNNFGCPTETSCGTNFLKRLTSINSSLSDRQSCNNIGLTLNAWISCPASVEFLEINNGFSPDVNIKAEFFPQPMTKLKELHLPHNRISKIDRRTFTIYKFPVLHTLNLSYNAIRDVKSIFSSPMNIKHLDLSHNSLRSVLDLGNLPRLETLKLINTQISSLLENDWTRLPTRLMHIDLSENSIRCDCSGFKWVNSTFPINSLLRGTCAEPPEVKGMKLRRASRALNERCNETGVIGAKIKKG